MDIDDVIGGRFLKRWARYIECATKKANFLVVVIFT